MFRGRVYRAAVFMLLLVSSTLVMAPRVSANAGGVSPFNQDDCKHDGWQTLVDENNSPFKNQGDCVAWKIHHPHIVGLDDLTGSFDGTSVFNFDENGCSFVHQVLDAIYPGSSFVGDVTLHIHVCVDGGPSPEAMTGTFTISTSAGTVAGAASGLLTVFTSPNPIFLVLSPTSGTGSFSGLTAPIVVNGLWFSDGSVATPEPFSGTVSVS